MTFKTKVSLRSDPGESLFIEGRDSGTCYVHNWTEDDFRARFVAELRRRHGKGGVNVCRDCVARLAALRDKLAVELTARKETSQ